jgi:hypothetical protein
VINQIGSHPFLRLAGEVCPPKEHLQGDGPMHRMGVDGSGFLKVGRWGDPFELESFVDEIDLDQCWTTFHEYRNLIDEDVVGLVQDDHDFATDGWEIKVVDVGPPTIHEVLGFTGGLNIENGEAGATLRCRWKVCAVEIVEE